MKRLFAILSILVLVAVSCRTRVAAFPDVTQTTADATETDEDELPWEHFRYASDDFEFEIDSCNISTFERSNDTIYITVFPPMGIIVEDRFFSVCKPLCHDVFNVVQIRQNRYFIDSMGPDPILSDMVYTAPGDTLAFDRKRGGFRIRAYSEEETKAFPTFDTIRFIRSYKTAVGENLSADYVPDIAKAALYREFLESDQDVQSAFDRAGVEVHQVFIEVYGCGKRWVLVFRYGHFG